MIYFNNAATSYPKPECVINAVSRTLQECPVTLRASAAGAPRGADALNDCRSTLAGFLGIEDIKRLVLTPGCTYAANQAITGLKWKDGDRMLMSGLEHHAVSRPIRKVAREHHLKFGVSPYRVGTPFDLNWLQNELRRGGVRLVACTMASNVTGEILPVADVVRLAHDYGALCLIDAAQTAGNREININELNCDMLLIAGHKGLMGPTGIGALYIGESVDLSVLVEGGTGADSGKHEMSTTVPHSYETGTHNVCAAAGLAAGVRWVDEHRQAIEAHEYALTARFLEGIDGSTNIHVLGSPTPENRTAVVSILMKDIEPKIAAAHFADKYEVVSRAGLHCAPLAHESIGTLPGHGTWRFSFGFSNTEAEVDGVTKWLRELS